jgi:hypothetical protein
LIKRFAVAVAFFGLMTGRTGVKTIELPCELPIFVIVFVMLLNYVASDSVETGLEVNDAHWKLRAVHPIDAFAARGGFLEPW